MLSFPFNNTSEDKETPATCKIGIAPRIKVQLTPAFQQCSEDMVDESGEEAITVVQPVA